MSDPAEIRLSLHTFTEGDATVVKCTGKLTFGITDVLRKEVKPLLQPNQRVVLDLTDLTQVDSMGLGTLVSLYVTAKAVGCELKLIHLSPRIREIFGMTKLSALFEVYGENITKIP